MAAYMKHTHTHTHTLESIFYVHPYFWLDNFVLGFLFFCLGQRNWENFGNENFCWKILLNFRYHKIEKIKPWNCTYVVDDVVSVVPSCSQYLYHIVWQEARFCEPLTLTNHIDMKPKAFKMCKKVSNFKHTLLHHFC
jgi:hypothetical protein